MPVQFIGSEKRRPHFRHRDGVCGFYTERDEEEHEDMKYVVYQWLRGIGVDDADYEVRVGENIADIYSPKLRLAVEVQFSGIDHEDLLGRTHRYTDNGVYVLWLFHVKFLSFGSRGAALLRSKAMRVASRLCGGRVFLLDQYAKKIYILYVRKHGKRGSVKRKTKYLCTFSALDLTRPASYRDVLEPTSSKLSLIYR